MTNEYRSSASQISTYELCPRKWAWQKIEGLRPPGNRFAIFGSVTHKHLEDWFNKKIVPPASPEGKVARAILVQLPPPQTPGLEVEHVIWPVLGGVKFKGLIDLRNLTLPTPWVSDHKTTSGLQWAKTSEQLVVDVQATLYAYDTMIEADTGICDLQWTYGTTRGKCKVLPVKRTVTREEIAPRIEKTIQSVTTMKQIFEEHPPVLEVPYDAGGCETFGGCPFQENCNLSPQKRIQSIMSQATEKNDFMAKLKARQDEQGSAAPHPPAAAVEEQPVNPTEPAPEPVKVPEPTKSAPKTKKTTKTPPKAKKTPPVEASVAPQAPTQDAVNILLECYRKGFLDGFAEGRKA